MSLVATVGANMNQPIEIKIDVIGETAVILKPSDLKLPKS